MYLTVIIITIIFLIIFNYFLVHQTDRAISTSHSIEPNQVPMQATVTDSKPEPPSLPTHSQQMQISQNKIDRPTISHGLSFLKLRSNLVSTFDELRRLQVEQVPRRTDSRTYPFSGGTCSQRKENQRIVDAGSTSTTGTRQVLGRALFYGTTSAKRKPPL